MVSKGFYNEHSGNKNSESILSFVQITIRQPDSNGNQKEDKGDLLMLTIMEKGFH